MTPRITTPPSCLERRHVYGPVASRRLGRSLGIDLVPHKVCSYDCVYCQLGRTTHRTLVRAAHVDEPALRDEIDRRLDRAGPIDFVTLAGSGEPTLHCGLGRVIRRLKQSTRTPVAVLTNGSLLWDPAVRDDLAAADLVLPTLSCGRARTFQRLHRPHARLRWRRICDGLIQFREQFAGRLWLEVFIVPGVNTEPAEIDRLAALLTRIKPDRIDLNTATRPPCERWVRPATGAAMAALVLRLGPAARIIAERPVVEADARGAAAAQDLLALLDRRPCTVMDVAAGLGLHSTEAAKALERLLQRREVVVEYRRGRAFYRRP